MDLAQDPFPAAWLIGGFLVYGAALARALVGLDLTGLGNAPLRQHLLGAASLSLMLLWQIRSDVTPGFDIHLLGMTAFTLMLGWRLAILGATLALIGSAVSGAEHWSVLGLQGAVLVLIPVAVSYCIWRLLERYMPANLFIYILGCGFFGACIATALARLVCAMLLLLSGAVDWLTMSEQYLPVFLITLFPESFVNGAFVAACAAYRPEWLATFDAERYLGR